MQCRCTKLTQIYALTRAVLLNIDLRRVNPYAISPLISMFVYHLDGFVFTLPLKSLRPMSYSYIHRDVKQ